ncbi:MAG: ABC transporter substrate-binding protein [Deferribacteres bacterium]|nr:ABC transporter substrate-binding protein [Deferribacteres bacterium]
MGKAAGFVVSIFVAALMVSAGVMFSGCEKADVKETFKIGVIAPLTGDIAFIGTGMKEAILMAKEQAGDDTRYNYEVVFEDDQNEQKLAASAAHKLISVDKVDALITLDSPSGNVVSPIALKNNVIHFGIAVDPNVAKGDTNFIHWTPATRQAELLARELKRRGIRKVGVFGTVSQAGWKVYGDEFVRAAEREGLSIVTRQNFHDGTKDFRNLIARAKPTRPDIYVIEAPTPELEILTRQMREAGIDTPLTGIETFEVSGDLGLFEGYFYVSAVEPTSAYTTAYKQKYNKNAPICSGNTYDIFNLIVSAVEKAGASSSKKPPADRIAAELRNIRNFSGALGILSIDESGIVQSDAQLKMVKNGEFVPLN